MKKIEDVKRIVVKVGTSTLTYSNGKMNLGSFDKIATVLSDLNNQGYEIVLVSSGSISVGLNKLMMKGRSELIRENQAAAAVGQCELMNIYSKFFSEYNNIVAQILLTKEDFDSDERCQNVINTFETLLEKGIIPIVNENDTVGVEEINFGDNDTLSAIVAGHINADMLIMLSDIDGLFTMDPKTNANATYIPIVYEITDELEANAGGAGTRRGTGGMKTKLNAAKSCLKNGAFAVIANGKDPRIVRDIIDGKGAGTLFVPQ